MLLVDLADYPRAYSHGPGTHVAYVVLRPGTRLQYIWGMLDNDTVDITPSSYLHDEQELLAGVSYQRKHLSQADWAPILRGIAKRERDINAYRRRCGLPPLVQV